MRNVPSEFQVATLEQMLSGHTRNWFRINKRNIVSIEEFERLFLEEFYTVPIRVAFKAQWASKKYYAKDSTLQEYFYSQLLQAKYFDPPVLPYEINFSIVQQMPPAVQFALSTVDFSQTGAITQALAQIDITHNNFHNAIQVDNQNNNPGNNMLSYGFWGDQAQCNNSHDNSVNTSDRTRFSSQQPNNSVQYRHNRGNGGYRHSSNARTNNMQVLSGGSLPDITKPPPVVSQVTPKTSIDSDNPDIHPKINGECQSLSSRINHIGFKDSFDANTADVIEEIREEIKGIDVYTHIREPIIQSCPHIAIRMGDIRVDALLDSGSEISAISEEFYKILKSKMSLNMLPVTGMQITLAVSKKATVVKHQALLPMIIEELEISHPVLIVPGLNQQMLLGSDWLKVNKVIFDFASESLVVLGRRLAVETVSFERGTSGRTNKVNVGDIQCRTLNLRINNDDNLINLKNQVPSDESGSFADFTVQSLSPLKPIQQLIQEYSPLFSDKPGCANVYEHKIVLSRNDIVVRKSYPVPLALRPAVDREIERMLKMGIIERSTSQFCNPLRIVAKKDESIRLCLDARFTNAVIEGDNECPPPISEIMQRFNGATIFSIIDLTSGYWQIALEPSSRQYTAFLNGSTLYQFTRVPFGLKTAGSGFIRALNLALGNQFNNFLTYYIDDLLIASKNEHDHMHHLEMVFKKLLECNFTINLKKAQFCQSKVPFLGFMLSADGVRPEEGKLKLIENFAVPTNRTELQQFLGICNFYRQFSIAHARFVDPFRPLLRKNEPWDWNETYDKAFTDLKRNFVDSILLSHYDLEN